MKENYTNSNYVLKNLLPNYSTLLYFMFRISNVLLSTCAFVGFYSTYELSPYQSLWHRGIQVYHEKHLTENQHNAQL